MKRIPGPAAECPCGPCERKRQANREHYRRNREAIIAANTRRKRLEREATRKARAQEPTDEEMDRRAAG
jgi:hypothetical protein